MTKHIVLKLPTLGLIIGTRAMLGVGVGLLLSSKLSDSRRRRVGMALIAAGAATTIPAARAVLGSIQS